MPSLILIRGIPGAGKTTVAKGIRAMFFNQIPAPYPAVHLEADQFFLDADGVYTYRRELIGEAHQWCQLSTLQAMKNGRNVIVSNTFTRYSEMLPYLHTAKEYDYKVQIIEVHGEFESVHNVPAETVKRMKDRFQSTKEIWDIYTKETA